MKIILNNHGMIFNVKENLPAHFSYAQSPQILNFGEMNRVYFSTRHLDSFGKPLSLIHFVDFDAKFERIITTSNHPVIELGELGTFDEHGIFPLHPRFINGQIKAFSTGWSRRASVAIETAIGVLEGNSNGSKFRRIGKGPIFGPSIHEPFLVGDAFVLENLDQTYFMYYIAGTSWKNDQQKSFQPERNYKIRMAVSNDLINWERVGKNIIPDVLGVDECQALPSVIRMNSEILMAFCYRETFDFRNNPKNAYRIGFAKSNDGVVWNRVDHEFGITSHDTCWDSEMRCYPHIFTIDNRLAMIYNGNQFGRNGFGLAVQEL